MSNLKLLKHAYYFHGFALLFIFTLQLRRLDRLDTVMSLDSGILAKQLRMEEVFVFI